MADYAVDYSEHAKLFDVFDEEKIEGDWCMLALKSGMEWPSLVVKQRCRLPGIFGPCALLVPETELLFLGVGERLLAYNLNPPSRLWEDFTDCGIWCWARHGDHVILSAELELAAWDIHGRKQWTMFVEPPWEYMVAGGLIHLDVMGAKSSFSIATGPSENR